MPTNKNALARFKYLDDLLSDRHHYYSIRELWEKCNEKLENDGFLTVNKRCTEKDIVFLEYAPFYAPIERVKKNGKTCVRYKRSDYSIFKKEMSDEERNLLWEVFNTLSLFDGLDNIKWLDEFKIGFGLKERRPIISFSYNPYLQNRSLLGILFDNISNEVVIRLTYHTFSDRRIRCIDFHPYLLKQYEDRWFLFGAADDDKKILSFALDRIDKVESLPEKKYEKCPDNLNERFDDIVGVTLYEDRPVEHIIFWVSDASKDYVITKPIHASQTLLKGEKEQQLRELYPSLVGAFFAIDRISNYELVRLLCSFGKDLIVLQSDGSIQNEIYQRICNMKDNYDRVRTLCSQECRNFAHVNNKKQ